MLSTSNAESVDVGDRILDAAASCVAAYGVERVTLAEIARRAGVSRPTVYRRWTDTREILAALLTTRVIGAWRDMPSRGTGRGALVERIVAAADRLRRDEVIMSVLRSSPELATVLIDAAAAEIEAAQRDRSVRKGDPRQLAAMVLLITQSTIQSAAIVRPILDSDELARELTHALNGYLS